MRPFQLILSIVVMVATAVAAAAQSRPAGVTMCAIFLLGLCVLPFAPETKDEPLPEEERGFSH